MRMRRMMDDDDDDSAEDVKMIRSRMTRKLPYVSDLLLRHGIDGSK